ncbi:MAG: polysaccharide deacetylase family protein, partial [Cytophagales bacterium]|nr:polysaccharide deacetylase family protein [Cytophagales bacterium]
MLKYVILSPVFWLVLLIGGTGCYFWDWNWWTLVIPSLIYSGLVAYGSYQIQWNFHLKSINRLPNTPHAVSITFDDGPIPGYTEKILDILDHHQVKATFFLIGNRVEAHPALAQKIVEQGHLIGNHSHNHTFWFDLHSFKQMRDELATCNDTAEKITGKKMRLFRPPYGVTTPIMTRVLKSNGMTSIGWTL